VDVLLPNEREACLLARERCFEKAVEILRDLVPLLVINRGPAGAAAYTASQCPTATARAVRAVDAVGAGDSFNAGFLHGWIRDWPVDQALAYGNHTGGWSTTENGGTTAFRNRERLIAMQQAWMMAQKVPLH
jgi:sugar/nucleoside kinase (ribokinase family)